MNGVLLCVVGAAPNAICFELLTLAIAQHASLRGRDAASLLVNLKTA